MAKYRATLADGRTVDAYAPSEGQAVLQVEHQERSRLEMNGWRARNSTVMQARQDDLKLLVDQYGAPIVEQIMKSTNGPDYTLPDFSLPPKANEDVQAMNERRKDSPNYDGPMCDVIQIVKLKD